jgi:hypothetical protein
MKKALWCALLALAILVVAVTPALAEENVTRRGRPLVRPFVLVGKVTAVDTESKTITVTVLRGNRVVKDFIADGKSLTVETTKATIIRRYGDPRGVFIGLDDVDVDDYVNIAGAYVPLLDKYYAQRVVVDVPAPRAEEAAEIA